MKRITFLAAIISRFMLLGAQSAQAALDPGCTTLGGADGAGTCVVPAGTHLVSGSITVAENLELANGAILDASASGVSLTVGTAANPGSFVMQKNSSIRADGDNISVTVPFGDMTMFGSPLGAGSIDKCGYVNLDQVLYIPNFAAGAIIISRPATIATTITIKVGNFPPPGTGIPPVGSFAMERCALVDVSTGGDSAGTIVITAGQETEIDGLVLSESTLGGTGANQKPGGGPITVKTGCLLTISGEGIVSSKGHDPGADLVHIEGCDVFIDGLVQSTGPGHAVPSNPPNHCATNGPNGDHSAKPANSTACVEIIGQNITISQTGEVSADVSSTGAGGSEGSSWIDIFSYLNTTIVGRTGANDIFSVHADSESGSDFTPNTITAKAGQDAGSLGTFTGSGKIISASAIGNGSFGGFVVVQASGGVNLNTSTIMAAGDNVGGGAANPPPCDGGAGTCGKGGTIDVRSFQSSIAWQSGVGNVNPDRQPSPNAGLIGLVACTTVNTLGTNFDNAVPTVNATTYTNSAGVVTNPNNQICGGLPTVPAYVTAAFDIGEPIWDACQPSFFAQKSGKKFNDVDNSGTFTPGDTPIVGWPISLYGPGPGFPLVTTVNTGPGGTYSFTFTAPGTFRVCEGVGPAGFVQTMPNALTVHPGETIVNTCPGPNIWGYEFTIVDGSNFVDDDFGNFSPITCQKQTAIDIMNNAFPGNKGPDITVKTFAPFSQSVQAAVDSVTDLNSDGFLIIMVIAKADGSLGGTSNQKVAVSKDYTAVPATNLPFGLIGCSVTLTGGGSDPAVWVKDTAKGKQTVINGKQATILVADLHGGKSAVGVQADGTLRYLRNEAANGNTVGIKVVGSNNTVHNGAASGNSGVGLQINGNSNYVTDTGVFSNSSHGVQVTGNSNQILKMDSGDIGKGNGADGFNVSGNSNVLTENKARSNVLDGFRIPSGTGNKLKKNLSGGTASQNNGACEFEVVAGNINDKENKANNVLIPGGPGAPFPTGCI